MNYYVDDTRPTPEGWVCYRTVNRFVSDLRTDTISFASLIHPPVFSFDHDAGDYEPEGGDYINALRALVQHCLDRDVVPGAIYFHSDNPVGVENMRAIVRSAIKVGLPMVENDGIRRSYMPKGSFIPARYAVL